jgi:F5/8 type C domain
MRKQLINRSTQNSPVAGERWLDLEYLAQVEITSENPAYPIESALIPSAGSGWRAAGPGEQTIRILFNEPQAVRRIQLLFHEDQRARTQEFVLQWSSDGGQSYREIVRQQYNFSPPNTTREVEDYLLDLAGLTVLELRILPDITQGDAAASVEQFRIA